MKETRIFWARMANSSPSIPLKKCRIAVASHPPPYIIEKKTISSASQMACRAMILEQSTILCEAPFWTGAIGLETKLDQTVETNGQTNRPTDGDG